MADNLPLQYQKNLVGGQPTMRPASATGHQFPNNGSVSVWVNNMRGSAITLTAATARDCEFGEHPDLVLTLAAATLTILPTFNATRFASLETGMMTFTLSETVDVEVAAVVLQQYSKET